jgi:DnaJ-class molecular chaperone
MSTEKNKIYRTCSRCQGDGIEIKYTEENGNQEIVCGGCGGIGRVEMYDLDITSLQEDIDKCLHRLKKIQQKIGAWQEGD